MACIRKKLGAHNNREMLHLLQKTPEHALSTLRFTQRGREVFVLIMQGMTSKRVSECLGMGVNGVKRHKEKMLLQNDCDTMQELIAKYRRAANECHEKEDAPY